MILRTLTIILVTLGIYIGGYWWFRMSRTYHYYYAAGPIVELPGVGRLSVLTWGFRPLVCVDAYFHPSAMFLLVDSARDTLMGDHPYPFARVLPSNSQ